MSFKQYDDFGVCFCACVTTIIDQNYESLFVNSFNLIYTPRIALSVGSLVRPSVEKYRI